MEDFLTKHHKKIVAVLIAAVIGIASSFIFGPDNPIEEGAEAFIETQTGLHIDASPGSVEPD